MEVAKRNDEYEEEQRAVYAGAIQEVRGGDEEDQIDRRCVCTETGLVRASASQLEANLQKEQHGYPAPEAEHSVGVDVACDVVRVLRRNWRPIRKSGGRAHSREAKQRANRY